MIPKFEKKNFSIVGRACRVKSIDVGITHCTLINIHISIRLNIFWFSANDSKTNLKFEKSFPLVCRACWDKSNDI